MHSPEEYEDRTRPWIVRNKLIGQVQFGKDKKRFPCVSLFCANMNDIPKKCWKVLKVKGMRKVLVCSKTLTFISSAKVEFHWDQGDDVVTHVFVDCIRDNFKPEDKKVFWKHQMELYFQLINSHYENVKELDTATVEEITKELAQAVIVENEAAEEAAEAAEAAAKDKPRVGDDPILARAQSSLVHEEDYDTMPELEYVGTPPKE